MPQELEFVSRTMGLLGLALVFASCGNLGVPGLTYPGICDGYSEESTSSYVLPYTSGTSASIGQGNCGPLTHTGDSRYAYDIGTSIGDAIIAARGGTVVGTNDGVANGGGCPESNHARVRHSDGTVAIYAHLSPGTLAVSVNDVIAQGAAIGDSGDSGCSTGPHLHFAVYVDEDSSQTVPVTFSNTDPHPNGLVPGRSYRAQ